MLYCDMCWNVSHSAVDSTRILLSILRSACRRPHRLWQDARFDQYIHNFNYKFPKYGWASVHNLFISACQLCPESHNNRLTRKRKKLLKSQSTRENFPPLHIYRKPITIFVLCQLTSSLRIHPASKGILQLGEFLISLDFENSCLMYSACDQGIWVYW